MKTLAELVAGNPAAEKELAALQEKVTGLEKTNAELSEYRKAQIEALRERGVKALGLLNGAESADDLKNNAHYQALTAAAEKGDEEYLAKLVAAQEAEADKKLPLRCQECASLNVSRQQSALADPASDGERSLEAGERHRISRSRKLGETLGGE